MTQTKTAESLSATNSQQEFDLLSEAQVAKLLGKSVWTLRGWRRFINYRYERILCDLYEREEAIKSYGDINPKDLHSMLEGIQKTRLQVYKGQREMNGLDVKQDDPALQQKQVTHFVLRPGGAMDLDN